MVNKGITVRQLHEILKQAVKDGYGDKHILISGDDEGNSFHTLFYGLTTDTEELKYICGIEHGHHDPSEVVALG